MCGQPPPSFHSEVAHLIEAMNYSLFNGGKRFRSVLALLVSEALNAHHQEPPHQTFHQSPPQASTHFSHKEAPQPFSYVGMVPANVLSFAGAVEMIHTYSLIHDDLPCMDNDDMRRGQPTNHKVYGEALALLTGDALLTEAFGCLVRGYSGEPPLLALLLKELVFASGVNGMVSGQAIDLKIQKASQTPVDQTTLLEMHQKKTGAMIAVAARGAAHIAQATPQELSQIETYAQSLGLAFQVSDDLLDYNPQKLESGSFPALYGLEGTKEKLKGLSEKALSAIEFLGIHGSSLRLIVEYNRERTY